MAIKSYNGYIYFNELLYRCMRRKYGNMKINKKMQIFELKTQYNIYLMTLDQQKKSKNLSENDIFNCIIKKENGVNPFLLVMNFKISFKTWLKFARNALKKDKKYNEDESEVTSEISEEQPLHNVEIEVEEYYSETSEEDTAHEESYSGVFGKKKGSTSGHVSGNGSALDLSYANREKKKRD